MIPWWNNDWLCWRLLEEIKPSWSLLMSFHLMDRRDEVWLYRKHRRLNILAINLGHSWIKESCKIRPLQLARLKPYWRMMEEMDQCSCKASLIIDHPDKGYCWRVRPGWGLLTIFCKDWWPPAGTRTTCPGDCWRKWNLMEPPCVSPTDGSQGGGLAWTNWRLQVLRAEIETKTK